MKQLLLLLFLFPQLAWAVEVSSPQPISLGSYAEFFLEEGPQALSLEEVLQTPTSAAFMPLHQDSPNFGAIGKNLWLRIPLSNSGKELHRVLTVSLSEMRSQAFLVSPEGSTRPLERLRDAWETSYLVDLPPHSTQLLYLRVDPVIHLSLDLSLLTLQDYVARNERFKGFFGAYYGVILVLCLYNLLIFLRLKHYYYVYFSIYAFCIAGLQSIYDGSLFPLHQTPEFTNQYGMFLLFLGAAAVLAYARSVLSTRQNQPSLDRALVILAWGMLPFLLLAPWPHLLSLLAALPGLGVPIFLIWAGLLSLKRGVRNAGVFSIAVLLYSVPMFLQTLHYLGVDLLGMTGFLIHSSLLKLGSMLEITLFALILGDYVRQTELAKQEAQANQLKQEQQHREELGKKVAERTFALQQAINTKDHFLSVLSHDLKGPTGSLQLLFESLLFNRIDLNEGLLRNGYQTAKGISHHLEQILTWAGRNKQTLAVEPSRVNLTQICQEALSLHQAKAGSKNIQLRLQVEARHWVWADPFLLLTVLKNLTDNALKFTPQGGSITWAATEAEGMVELTIADTGLGMSLARQEEILTSESRVLPQKGTEGERGAGMGMMICRDAILKMGGRFGLESDVGLGTCISLHLPMPENHPAE